METRSKCKERIRKANLDAMPPELIEHILKDCDFSDFMALRKTCKHTRNMVDVIQPDPKLEYLSLCFSPTDIHISLSFLHSPSVHSCYIKQNGGCLLVSMKDQVITKERFVEETSAEEMFRKDLKILLPMLMHQKVPMERCDMSLAVGGFPVFRRTLVSVWRELNTTLYTKELRLFRGNRNPGLSMSSVVSGAERRNIRLSRMHHDVLESLRKSCRRSRIMDDLIHPNPKIDWMELSWHSTGISIFLGQHNSEVANLTYDSQNGGCLVTGGSVGNIGRRTFIADTSAEEIFLEDFKVLLPLLMHQENPLERISLRDISPNFKNTATRLLHESNARFRTKSLEFSVYSDNFEIMPFLSLVSPDDLTELNINSWINLDFSGAVDSEQWKNVKQFTLFDAFPDTPQRFLDFPNSFWTIPSISPECMTSLKETFRAAPPTFKELKLTAYEPQNRKQIERAVSRKKNKDKVWYFSMSTPGCVLRIRVGMSVIFFTRLDRAPSSVPEIEYD